MQTKTISEIHIRRAQDLDTGAIADLLFESFVEYRSLYTPEGFSATAITADQIKNRIAEGPVWVAVLDDLIVGTVSVIRKSESLYIRGMAVSPSLRGQRIGELLLTQIEEFAAAHNLRHLLLSTTPFLSRAIRLYEHFGFRRSDEGLHDLFGTPLFSMEKTR